MVVPTATTILPLLGKGTCQTGSETRFEEVRAAGSRQPEEIPRSRIWQSFVRYKDLET